MTTLLAPSSLPLIKFKTRDLNFKTSITMQTKKSPLFLHKPRLDDVDAISICDLFCWHQFNYVMIRHQLNYHLSI